VIETCVLWTKLPLVPVTVNTLVPVGPPFAAVNVNVEVPAPPATEAGLNEAVTRDGNPLTLRLTAPVKPFWLPMVTVNVVELDRLTF
jgi:hypothetical protein